MIRIETKRLIIKSKLDVGKGELIHPPNHYHEIDIFTLAPFNPEDIGFAVYLKSNESTPIAEFAFLPDKPYYELTYSTEESYRRQGYLYEALSAFLHWFFADIGAKSIRGFINDTNTPSINLALKLGFQPCNKEGKSTWYELKNPMSHEKQDLDTV